jgi:ABC-2 type transport system ATP-binding protein
MLDEPMNGLDPEGIADMRATIRDLPERTGATVFLSSHLLSEVEQIASHVGVMRAGRLVAQGPVATLIAAAAPDLFVRTGADGEADRLLHRIGLLPSAGEGGLLVPGQGSEGAAARIARLLVQDGIAVHELSPRRRDLEALYISLQTRREA